MKLTFFMVLLLCFNASASLHAQKITIHEKGAPLQKVLQQIEKQSGYTIIYENDLLNQAQPVTISINNTTLEDALTKCFTGQSLTYTIVESTVVVKAREKSLIQKVKENFKRPVKVSGKVTDSTGLALRGASIRIKSKPGNYSTEADGSFSFETEPGDIITISFVGYDPYVFTVIENQPFQNITLRPANNALNEVAVVSTGYQDILKERVTGSFEKLDNGLINRKVGTNIIDRLDGSSSILFDKRNTQFGNRLQLRGMFSILQETSKPLIVIDNFPFDGDINDLNPNDVENITLLKDANASSIWGTRSGNGVIVITTKKGRFNQPVKVSFGSNITISPKPNLFNMPVISPSEFIDLEISLFGKGFYDDQINDPYHGPVSQVVDILHKRSLHQISSADSARQIDMLRKYDVRDDFNKFIYRTTVNQQYTFDVSGGSDKINYRLSAGYDKNVSGLVGNGLERKTARLENNILLSKNLALQTGIAYTISNVQANSPGDFFNASYKTFTGYNLSPYARFANDAGNALPISKQYLTSYLDTLGNGKLLDWQYRPLDEINYADNKASTQTLLADIGLRYKIIKGLNAELKYQYQRLGSRQDNVYSLNTFYARNLINNYTNLGATDVSQKYPIPRDGILDRIQSTTDVNNIRGQLNFEQHWQSKHLLSIMAGGEIRDNHQYSDQFRIYGYNKNLNVSPVDYLTRYPTYEGFNNRVPQLNTLTDFTSRYVSAFGNASYTYDDRYTIFASARNDGSNLFGIKTRNKWNPFWSTGLGWDISKEKFYGFSFIPYLKLRASYGFNGNVYLGQSAYTTINYASGSEVTNLPFARIANPPNPSLRWEEVRTANFGLDLRLKKDLLSVSVDYYQKRSSNVFGDKSLDPTTGISGIFANSANIEGSGFEVQLASTNINKKDFKWRTNLLINKSTYRLTKYLLLNQSEYGFVSSGEVIIPIVGFNPYEVVSYRWAGLDNLTGQPVGILNGHPSMNYDSIANFTKNQDQVIHGSAVPTVFGNLLNTVSWKNLSISVNLTYKFGYYFRKPALNYYTALNLGQVSSEYLDRWQKPGDEKVTNVPALTYPVDYAASNFYQYAEINVGKGDHIRINDVRLGYNIDKNSFRGLPFANAEMYFHTGLNMLIWKANKFDLDPDYPAGIVPPKTFTLGFKITL